MQKGCKFKVVAMALVFEEQILRVICAYAPQMEKLECKNNQFYNDKAGCRRSYEDLKRREFFQPSSDWFI